MEPDPGVAARASQPGRILLVDDDAVLLGGLSELLREVGYEVETSRDPLRAQSLVETFDPELVLADLRMPGLDGMQLMERVRARSAHRVFIIMTAYSSLALAVEAIKRGAENFIAKPFRFETLHDMVAAAVRTSRFLAERASGGHAMEVDTLGLTGSHPSVRAVREKVQLMAAAHANVLVTGEPGTGKSLVARALYGLSRCADGPFVRVCCGADDDAFSPSSDRNPWDAAQGGTLCLDELAQASIDQQARLLHLIRDTGERADESAGDARIGVRIVAIGDPRLDEMMARGQFLKELYYRLNVLRIETPALRNRRSDIPALAQQILLGCADRHGSSLRGLSDTALSQLISHAWPGNVRELEQVLERAVILSHGNQSVLPMLPELPGDGHAPDPAPRAYEAERESILRALRQASGDIGRAARLLGVSVGHVEGRLREYEH